MTTARVTRLRRLAVLAGVLALWATTVGSAVAADPVPARPRDAGRAWDQGLASTDRQVIVTFRDGTSRAERARASAAAGLTDVQDLRSGGAAAYRSTRSVGSLRRTLLATGAVASVSVDLHLQRFGDPTGERYWGLLWGLNNTGQPVNGVSGTPNMDIDGLQAAAITGGDPAVVVAVIDDGVDFSHPDLAARAWTNPGESGPDGLGGQKETNGIDDDGNGYIDDVHGWDFCNNDNTVHDFDHDFHGTHVAGTIAASLDGQGVVGVAPNVTIMALKFLDDDPTKDCGLTSMAIEAIVYARSFGVTISNDSWGGNGPRPVAGQPSPYGDFQPLYDAIRDSGMLFVAAAGNSLGGGIDNDRDPSPAYPASFDLPNIVSVAAADRDGGLADFSNYGHTTVDIAAPGVDILSALPADSIYPVGWGYLDGTSMATPHVTGVAALIASRMPALRTSAGVPALRTRLLATGKALPLTVGDTVTGRMVDARFALDQQAPVALPPNRFGFVVGAVLGRTTVRTTVSWPAAADDSAGVRNYDLATQTGAGGWTAIVGSTTARTANRTLTLGANYRFGVRARDRAGNVSPYAEGPAIVPRVYQETTSLATYGGTWRSTVAASASGRRMRYATTAGAWVKFRFIGRAVAVVAPKGRTRGSANVYVDGAYIGRVSLYRSTTVARSVVFGRSWTTPGTHTVKLVLVGTVGHPRFDIDAFAVLR
jgi:Subtilisin-like serine proteases